MLTPSKKMRQKPPHHDFILGMKHMVQRDHTERYPVTPVP
jgi:hypothetical protein